MEARRILAVVVLAMPAMFMGPSQPARAEPMKERKLNNVTLVYSSESEPLADELLKYAAKCNEYLARWFNPAEPVEQHVYWLARKDWRTKPENYGFPYASGPNAFLAAADVDLPTQRHLHGGRARRRLLSSAPAHPIPAIVRRGASTSRRRDPA